MQDHEWGWTHLNFSIVSALQLHDVLLNSRTHSTSDAETEHNSRTMRRFTIAIRTYANFAGPSSGIALIIFKHRTEHMTTPLLGVGGEYLHHIFVELDQVLALE